MLRPVSYFTNQSPINQRWLLLLPLAFVIIMVTTIRSGAQSIGGNINIKKGAEVWIEGSASIANYTCKAEELSGAGEIENTRNPASNVQRAHGDVHIAVELPVKTLNCGKRAMNKDMYEALKADKFPSIKYQLLDATLADTQDADTSEAWMNIRTRGIMEIAGVQDTLTIYVKGRVLDNRRFHVKGSKPLNMDTFDIKPPTAMFGLIKASKELTVHFDVTVELENKAEAFSERPKKENND